MTELLSSNQQASREVPAGSSRWNIADWLNFLRGCIDADIRGLGGYIVRQGDLLPGKLKEAADELERLLNLLHDAGAAFTGGDEHCATCRRVYNQLAISQGWASFPDETNNERQT